MDEMKGIHIIKALRSKWLLISIAGDAMVSGAVAFLLAILANRFFGWSGWWGILFGGILLLSCYGYIASGS